MNEDKLDTLITELARLNEKLDFLLDPQARMSTQESAKQFAAAMEAGDKVKMKELRKRMGR